MAYGTVELNPGADGATVAFDTVAGASFQRVKVAVGAEGAATDVSDSNPMPIDDAGGSLTVDDGGTSLTVDGTVSVTGVSTAANQSTANGLLTTIDADTGNIATAASAIQTAVQVMDDWDESDRAKVNPIVGQAGVAAGAGAVGTTTQRVTLASDDPAVALLGTIDADTGAIAASLAGTLTVDGSGSTQPVSGTVTANLSATDNAVLDVVASPVATISATPLQRVAIFDAADAQITSFGGGTEYTEDAAAAANPVGKANILVRADAPAGVASADGDNVAQRGTNFGAAYCQIVDSSGNFVDSFGGAGGTSSADDADFTAGTTLGTIAQGVYESTPTSVTDGDVGAVGITSDRQLKTSDAAAVALLTTIDADTGSAAALLGTIDADTSALAGAVSGTEVQVDIVASLPAGSNTIGVVDLGATDNAVLDAIAASVAGTLTVDLGANNDVIASGVAAHDAAVSGNPVLMGGEARTTFGTAVASGDAVRAMHDRFGRTMVKQGGLPEVHELGSVTITDTSSTTVLAASGSGFRHVVTGILVVNGHATVGTKVTVRSATSTTNKATGYAAALGGGYALSGGGDILRSGDNETITAICGTTGADVDVAVWGYLEPV